MSKNNIRTFAGLFVLTLLFGCSEYEGDGQLIDHGPLKPNNRYTLALGDINLGEDGHYQYSISSLPEGSYVFGLFINSDDIIREPLPINAKLRIVIKDSKNKIFVEEHAFIQDWIWTTSKESTQSFVYRRKGAGTYLKVLPNKFYTLDLFVSNADGSGDAYQAILIGQMGGRK